jgi:hypothetical protein
MEAALIALALLWHSKSSDEIDLPRWISMVLKEDLSYGTTGWLQPPSMGDWQRPDGHIHTAVKSIDTDVANCMVYGTALQRWGNLIKPPPVGSLKKWFTMLGTLEIKRQKKNVKRAPYICLEAARLLHHHEDELRAALSMEPMRQTRAAALTAAARVPPGFKEQMEELMEEQMDELKERSSKLRAERDEFKAAWKQRGLEIEELTAQLAKVTNELSVCKASTGRLVDDLEQRHQADLVSLNESIVKATLELERVRERCAHGRTAELELQIAEQSAKIMELSGRRDNNMGATKLLNLEKRRVEELKRMNAELRSTITTNWSKETLELAQEAMQLPRLKAEMVVLKETLEDMEAEAVALKRVVYPPPPMEGGAFAMPLRFMVMKLIAIANVCHSHVPEIYTIMASYFGIQLPGRWRQVLVKVVDGVRKYEKKYLLWYPRVTTCENIRSEMGPLSQLQVGEAIIAGGGTEGNFAVHSDAASSEGRELSAFVLGHRPPTRAGEPSRIQNLLFDIRWAMDKTAATRAADFRSICRDVAALCLKAEMKETEKIAELKPSAAMNDRANAELLAARLMTESEHVNPTCGEHGAAVNPMAAATKAMDAVVRGWMGKSDAAAELEAHKVRALHMAVGWNSSPSGALIYCTSKYAATHSDKGYAVGQEARGYNEYLAQLNPDDRESILALGHMEDLLSIKGSRSYVTMLNAPIVDRIMQDGPGSFYRYLKENEELANPGGGRIRQQIIAGAESPETRACVRAEAIIGDFFGWPILRALKHRPADGSDPHILDMAPIYQEALKQLKYAMDKPRLVATNQLKLLPSYPHLYPQSAVHTKTKDGRVRTDMARIYNEAENCTRMEELLKAGLTKLAEKFEEHTHYLQVGGALTGANVTPELRAKLSGVNRTNTVVESVFALEKFLSTREKGSNLVYRRGWTLFKYNKTWAWGELLNGKRLKLYGEVSRKEAARLRKEEGSQREQLARLFKAKAAEREAKLAKLRARAAAREAERARLHDPLLRCTTFSGLKLLQNPQLIEQLKIRRVVDGGSESSGKPLICSPPPKGGRAWLVMKLQGLMELEFKEKKIDKNPNDLKKGDLGCDSRAPRTVKARAAPSETKGSKGSKGGSRKRKAAAEWDDEQEEWPVEAIIDSRGATADDVAKYAGVEGANVTLGSAFYLVVWEGWDSSYNSWEPYSFIVDDHCRS